MKTQATRSAKLVAGPESLSGLRALIFAVSVVTPVAAGPHERRVLPSRYMVSASAADERVANVEGKMAELVHVFVRSAAMR